MEQVGGLLAALVLGIHDQNDLEAILDILNDRVLCLVVPRLVVCRNDVGRGILQQYRFAHRIQVDAACHPLMQARAMLAQVRDHRGYFHE
ncbi:hypothetical protein D3C77_549550 [compost metagenome]